MLGKKKKITSFKVPAGTNSDERVPLGPIKPYLLFPPPHLHNKRPPKHCGLPSLYKAGRRRAIKIRRLNWPFERLHLFSKGLSFKTRTGLRAEATPHPALKGLAPLNSTVEWAGLGDQAPSKAREKAVGRHSSNDK